MSEDLKQGHIGPGPHCSGAVGRMGDTGATRGKPRKPDLVFKPTWSINYLLAATPGPEGVDAYKYWITPTGMGWNCYRYLWPSRLAVDLESKISIALNCVSLEDAILQANRHWQST